MTFTIANQQVNQVLEELTLSHSVYQGAAILTATLLTQPADTYFPRLTLALGDPAVLQQDGTSLFVGGVQEMRRSPQRVELTAYDRGVALTRNELYGAFAGTGAQIAAQIAQRLGIATGSVQTQQGYQTILSTAGQSAYDLLRQAVGPGVPIYMEGEKLCVGPGTGSPVAIPNDHILEIESVGDLTHMVNSAVVLKRGTAVPLASAQNGADITKYGQFQAVRTSTGGDPGQQARDALAGLAFSASLTVTGDLALRCGGSVSLESPQAGLSGAYAVTALTHRWRAGVFTSHLTLEQR